MARHVYARLQAKGATVTAEEFSRGQDNMDRALSSLVEPGVRRVAAAPASVTSSGEAGDCFYDESYLYLCVDTNTWRRVALSTW